MHYLIIPRPLLVAVAFSYLAQCDTTSGPWIFPHVSNPAIPNVSNLTVHNNDSIIVEYTKFPYTTAINMGFNCFDSVKDAVGNQTYLPGFTGFGPYNNTGKLKYDLSSESDIIYSVPCQFIEPGKPCPPPDLTYCQFVLFNASIDSCSWGPWGVGLFSYSANYTVPLYYGPVFRVLAAANNTKPTLWINAADKTESSVPASMTATKTVNVTCPPSGIPASTTMIAAYETNVWPPMASNLTFPVWSVSDDEDGDDEDGDE